MTKLTGREAGKLFHIARYPKSAHSQKLAEILDGEAREIALILTGKKLNMNPERYSERQEIAEEFRRRVGKKR